MSMGSIIRSIWPNGGIMAIVKRQGRQWGVYVNGALIEGGFFSRAAAQRCADEYNAAAREVADNG